MAGPTNNFYYICNIFEDIIRQRRGITSDTPAATNKVRRICRAVRSEGAKVYILSLGRGRQRGTLRWYPSAVRRIDGVPILYAGFLDFPLMTHAASMFALVFLLIRLKVKGSTFIYYNHQIHYLLALMVTRISGARCILDLEDGYDSEAKGYRALFHKNLLGLYDRFCNGGAMLSSSVLKAQIKTKPQYVCYGVAPAMDIRRDWAEKPLSVLFGGSLLRETGTGLFIEALKILHRSYPEVLGQFRFIVTGFGDMAGRIQELERELPFNILSFRGKVSTDEYTDILIRSHIGLCLKIPGIGMGDTTFPSKVVELAAYGLLVVSTRVSDVPKLFANDSAMFLDRSTPESLVEIFRTIAEDPDSARDRALQGRKLVNDLLCSKKIGIELLSFWNGSNSTC